MSVEGRGYVARARHGAVEPDGALPFEPASFDAILVDATEFFLRDSHDLGGRLDRSRQGSYSVDEGRSAIFLPRTRAFPDNTEVEALVTFTGSRRYEADGRPASSILPFSLLSIRARRMANAKL